MPNDFGRLDFLQTIVAVRLFKGHTGHTGPPPPVRTWHVRQTGRDGDPPYAPLDIFLVFATAPVNPFPNAHELVVQGTTTAGFAGHTVVVFANGFPPTFDAHGVLIGHGMPVKGDESFADQLLLELQLRYGLFNHFDVFQEN